jgi:Glyoxalase-like domain
MPVRLHHVVIDAHDLPALARFWPQALGWRVLSERENEIAIGTDENAPLGICFMPVTDSKTVKNRVHLESPCSHPLPPAAWPASTTHTAPAAGRPIPAGSECRPQPGTTQRPSQSRRRLPDPNGG